MDTADMTGALGFGTLIVGLTIAIIIWAKFMRDPDKRHPMKGERERNIDEIRDQAGDEPTSVNTLNSRL